MGNAVNNMGYDTYKELQELPQVKWTIPISMGDTHKGYRVIGTTNDYFNHFMYGRKQNLKLIKGVQFSSSPFDVVIGANVAKKLSYNIGDEVVVSHGAGKVALVEHSSLPFKIVGILAPTGTPVDNCLFTPLSGIEAIHLGWETGVETVKVTPEQALLRDLTPKSITSVYIGLKKRGAVFKLQREINEGEKEPLMAIMPGAALFSLWKIMGSAEKALSFIAIFVVLIGLISLLTAQLAILDQRRREMALLRSLGATPAHLFRLLFLESFSLTLAGCLTGLFLLYIIQAIASVPLQSRGFYVEWSLPSLIEWGLLGLTMLLGVLNGLIPAILTYRNSLTDGMSIRS